VSRRQCVHLRYDDSKGVVTAMGVYFALGDSISIDDYVDPSRDASSNESVHRDI
jgi:hypothetical protein